MEHPPEVNSSYVLAGVQIMNGDSLLHMEQKKPSKNILGLFCAIGALCNFAGADHAQQRHEA